MSYSVVFFFLSSRRRHTRLVSDWSSDVCSSDLPPATMPSAIAALSATRAAMAEGIVAGGGAALLHAEQALDDLDVTGDYATGVEIVQIGRASCRGRGGSCGGAGRFEKKTREPER